MKLKEITLCFENCDQITIDGKYVGNFLVDDIHTSIQRIGCNAINRLNVANIFAIEIHKDANKERCSFGCVGDSELTFDRLTAYCDITRVEFDLIDDFAEDGQDPDVEHYSYLVDWVGDSDDENEAQKTYISKAGYLYIIVAKNKSIQDFFELETINDVDCMDFVSSMYDIGDEYGKTYE